jgi:hypothetical protein
MAGASGATGTAGASGATGTAGASGATGTAGAGGAAGTGGSGGGAGTGGGRTFTGSCQLGTAGTPAGVCFDLYDMTPQEAMDQCSNTFGGTWRGTAHCSTSGTDHCCTTAPQVDACYWVSGTC